MAFLLENIPRFECLVRKEYTQDLSAGHGEYLEASAEAIMAVRADSLWFQVVMKEPHAGVPFLLPIEALVTQPCCTMPTKQVMPWDCFSSEIGVCELRFARRGAVKLVKDGMVGEYRFTVAFTGSDLADMPSQRKLLHVIFRQDGVVGAYPNNRLLFIDRALFGDFESIPEGITTLTHEFRAEGVASVKDQAPPDGKSPGEDEIFYGGPSPRPPWEKAEAEVRPVTRGGLCDIPHNDNWRAERQP